MSLSGRAGNARRQVCRCMYLSPARHWPACSSKMTSKISWMITGRLIDLVENLMKNSTLCVHARNNWRMGTEVFQIFADFLQAWSGRKETRADMIRRGQKKTTHLEIRISPLKKEAFNLRFQKASGQLENTSRVRVVRRSIARILTILSSKKENV